VEEALAMDFTVSEWVVSASNISADYSHISSLKMYYGLSHVNTNTHTLLLLTQMANILENSNYTTQIINAVLEIQLI